MHGRKLYGVRFDDRNGRKLDAVCVWSLVARKAVGAEKSAFGNRLHTGHWIKASNTSTVGQGGDRFDAGPADESCGVGGHVADGVDVEVLAFAEPSDDDASRGDLPHCVDEGEFASLAANITLRDEARDRAIERMVDCACAAARGGDAFEQIDDDRVRRRLRDIPARDSEFHRVVTPKAIFATVQVESVVDSANGQPVAPAGTNEMTAADERPRANGARRAWQLSARVGLHEIVAVVSAFLIYFLIRGLVVGRAGEAMVRGFNVIDLEQRLHIYWELEMQSWILDHYWMIKVANGIYFWGHMPLIILTAGWLYTRHRPAYRLARNAFLASGAIGVVIYWAFPVAPPRLIPFGGFIDTMAAFDRVGYNAQETQAFVNEFAAIPSLHFGWSLLLGVIVAYEGKRPLFWLLGAVWPIAMFFSVIMTGNHFILDAVAGGIVSFAGLGVAWLISRYQPGVEHWIRDKLWHVESPDAR